MLRKFSRPYKVSVRRGAASAAADAGPAKAILQLVRYDPATNRQRIESYEYDKHHDYMVLDLITAIKAHQDPSLAFRASCCEGVCGSCAMNINGINSLACITAAEMVTTVAPLPNFPVIKDFVVDLRQFFRQYASIRPFVRNDNIERSNANRAVERYNALTRAIHGDAAVDSHDPHLATKYVGGVESNVAALLRLLDATVQSGNVTHTVTVLERLSSAGLALHEEKVREILLRALENHGKTAKA